MFVDARQLRRVVLEVTQACNHRCLHCYNYWDRPSRGRPAADTLSREEIRQVIRRIRVDAPLDQVVISGGEPLVRRDLPDIVCDLVDDGLQVSVITNATRLTAAVANRLPAGTQIETTLFSADHDLHDRIAGRPGAFVRTLRGVVEARTRGFPLAVTVVVSALNANDVYRTIELALGLGAEAILLNRTNLTARILREAAGIVPSRRQLADALAAADRVAARYGAVVSVSVPIPPCVVDPADYPHVHFGFCPRGGAEAYYTISHDGRLRPCNHSSTVLGDLRRERFARIVSSSRARRFWEPVAAECADCRHPLRDDCLGGCAAAADECFGSPRRLDPVVTLAAAVLPS